MKKYYKYKLIGAILMDKMQIAALFIILIMALSGVAAFILLVAG